MNLSASSQNYLKVVWGLQEWSDAPVTTSALAQKVGVTLSTASDAVRKLTKQGYLKHAPYGAVTLTEAGYECAIAMVRRHRLIETFLVDVLNYRWDQVHDEAEELEHAVSDFMIERMDEYLGYPTRDPHGDPIPAADGTINAPDARTLSECHTGDSVKVERISDADPHLLQFFTDHHISIGTVIQIADSSPYSDNVNIRVDAATENIALGQSATDAIWVTDTPTQ